MRELLEAIQDQLQEDSDLTHITDTNIVILVDPNLLPSGIGFPAIGLKDGSIDYVIEEPESWEVNYYVDIYIYHLLTSDNKCLVGQGSGSDPHGIFKLADDIHSSLFDNELSITGMEIALPYAESASEIMGTEDLFLVMKKLTYMYRKLETHPT